jgi:hypothetical protein
MDNLILTMIVAHDDYGDSLGFTKTDIDNIMNKYNYLNNIGCNEKGHIILWQHKYISDDVFAKYMDVKIVDNDIYLVARNFGDILSEKKYETEIAILDGETEPWDTNYYDADIDYHEDKYTDDTLQAIIDHCVKNGLEIEDELITNENTKIVDSTIYFNDEKLLNYIDDDSLDDLKNALSWGIIEAQESANQDEIYTKLKDSFESNIGDIKWEENKLIIKLNVDMEEVLDFLTDSYNTYDFEDENYGDLKSILNEMDYFDIDTPDYNYIYGTIDKETLNEYTKNRLDN